VALPLSRTSTAIVLIAITVDVLITVVLHKTDHAAEQKKQLAAAADSFSSKNPRWMATENYCQY
jgi:hypothetical protein